MCGVIPAAVRWGNDWLLAPLSGGGLPLFANVAQAAGLSRFHDLCGSPNKDYLVETVGSGVAIFDYDGDGLADILLISGSRFDLPVHPRLSPFASRLFHNNGDGTFSDVTDKSGLVNTGWGMGVAVADYDNDGRPDVYITNYGRNALFHNNGDGTFSDVTEAAGVGGGNWSTGCAWGDFDGDGRLDLYVARYVDFDRRRIPPPGAGGFCRYLGVPVACGPRGLPGLRDLLYHNEGNGKFREVAWDAGVRDSGAYGFSVVWCDFDNDGRPDIYVANDSMPNYLWHNVGGRFEEIGLEAGCALSGDGQAQASMGIALGDYNNDGWLDLFVTNFSEDYSTLYRNRGGQFEDVTFAAGLGVGNNRLLKWGAAFLDTGNSGWKDIFAADGHIYPQAVQAGNSYRQPNQLYRNLRNGRFELAGSAESGFTEWRSSRGAAVGDLENRGALSIVVNNIDDEPFLYRRASAPAGHWLQLRLIGARCNRDAIGARVRVTAGGLTQTDCVASGGSYLSCHDIRLHFGLGEAAVAETVEIRWPDNTVETRRGLPGDREHVIRQGEGI